MSVNHKTILNTLALCLALTLGAPPASSQSSVRAYAVDVASVMDNCGKNGLQVTAKTAQVSEDQNGLRVDIQGIPPLTGKVDQKGKLRLSAKQNQSRISANGRESKKSLQLVLIIEQFEGNKPTCTQSFSVQGKRK